jgi:hypothetical protein
MKKRVFCVLGAALVSGCAYSIKDVDVSKAAPMCVRECTATYSACVSGGPSVGLKTETLRACGDAYAVCIASCPAK